MRLKKDAIAQKLFVTSIAESFFDFKKSPEDGIAMPISKIKKIAKQLHDAGEAMSENMAITKILGIDTQDRTDTEEFHVKTLYGRSSHLGIKPEEMSGALAVKSTEKQIKCHFCKKFSQKEWFSSRFQGPNYDSSR
uniref:Uncharacterized protein n=1 Tax=Megaselia scalaris TaxID=36166 RepID=T1GWJ7_MEGSC